MTYNQNSGYGQLVQSVPMLPQGQVFVVGKSGLAGLDIIEQRFQPHNGVVRHHTTIDAAIGDCVANRGDVIYVAPGHTEDIASATSIVVDVAGISIIGLGQGALRPKLTFSATASSLELDAANVLLKNLVLETQVSAVVVGINVDAANITLEEVEMNWELTGDDFVTMIDVDGVNGFTLKNCSLIAEDTAGCAEAIRLDDCDDVTIEGNNVYGDFTDGIIIGEGAAGKNLLIKNNTFYNSDTTAGFIVDLNVAFTGVLSHNSCGTLYATDPETTIDPGSLLCIENYVCNAVDESGAIVPTAIST